MVADRLSPGRCRRVEWWQLILLVSCMGLCGLRTAQAFDGKRTGFTMGFAVGGGAIAIHDLATVVSTYSDTAGEHILYSSRAEDRTLSAVATTFSLGFGFSDRLRVGYVNRVDWYSGGGPVTAFGSSGAGITWFLSPRAPGFYLRGDLGATTNRVLSEPSDGVAHFGWTGAMGYECRRHWSLEAAFTRSRFDSFTRLQSFQLMLEGTAY